MATTLLPIKTTIREYYVDLRLIHIGSPYDGVFRYFSDGSVWWMLSGVVEAYDVSIEWERI